jgi:uncharacterized protein YjcR
MFYSADFLKCEISQELRGGDVSDVKDLIKNDYLSGIMPKKLAEKYDVSLNTIKSWIKRYGWSGLKNKGAPSKTEGAPSDVQGAPRKRKRGGQPGNKNAVGHGAPVGNKNAEKFGFFSKYLPEETISIMREMPEAPLDILWHEIQIAYAAIIRAQQIMYVKNREDKTIEKVEAKDGVSVTGEKWEVQQAWDKHSNFLQAQAKAQKELRGLIKQYDELLNKNWGLATEEQKARISQIKANTDRLRKDFSEEDDGGVEIINDAAEEKASQNIGDHYPEVPGDIQQQDL